MGAHTTSKRTPERVRHVDISNVQLEAVIAAIDSTLTSARPPAPSAGHRDTQGGTQLNRSHQVPRSD